MNASLIKCPFPPKGKYVTDSFLKSLFSRMKESNLVFPNLSGVVYARTKKIEEILPNFEAGDVNNLKIWVTSFRIDPYSSNSKENKIILYASC